MYSKFNVKQRLLFKIRGEVGYLHSLKKGEGTEIMYPVLCEPFEDNPEYIVYYIDLFHLSNDLLEKEILATVISGVCNYAPVIEFLTSKPVNPWSKSAFDEEVPLSESELQSLLSLPEGQRMSYDPADEPIVQELLAELEKNEHLDP